MEKGDIVAVVNMAGEYVGKVKEIGISMVILENPRMVINGPEGMGFARGVCVTGLENPPEVSFYTSGIVFVSPVNERIEKSYLRATTGLVI